MESENLLLRVDPPQEFSLQEKFTIRDWILESQESAREAAAQEDDWVRYHRAEVQAPRILKPQVENMAAVIDQIASKTQEQHREEGEESWTQIEGGRMRTRRVAGQAAEDYDREVSKYPSMPLYCIDS